jgi:hypothetical protein
MKAAKKLARLVLANAQTLAHRHDPHETRRPTKPGGAAIGDGGGARRTLMDGATGLGEELPGAVPRRPVRCSHLHRLEERSRSAPQGARANSIAISLILS